SGRCGGFLANGISRIQLNRIAVAWSHQHIWRHAGWARNELIGKDSDISEASKRDGLPGPGDSFKVRPFFQGRFLLAAIVCAEVSGTRKGEVHVPALGSQCLAAGASAAIDKSECAPDLNSFGDFVIGLKHYLA